MGSDPEKSLGDDATFAGAAKRRTASELSIGDDRTLGDNRSGQDTVIDDIEIVDLDVRYRVEGMLGQGGMGAVMLATDTRLNRKVAIKRILGESAQNRMAVARFLTEAKAIAAISHPNVVQIFEFGRTDGGPFLIMEYVDGGSLLDRCKSGPLSLEEAIELTCQLCEGLTRAHRHGIVHRDIKPSNILLTTDGIPKLADFGLAKATDGNRQMTLTGKPMGTPDFMPPEQQRNASSVDHRSDLWSLVATFYQVVTGRSPKVIRLHELPRALQPIMAKALEDDRAARYQSARELREALRGVWSSVMNPGKAVRIEGVGQEGECAACGTMNEPTRKFCRNPQCGAALTCSCLKCEKQIPVWETICGECGANQPKLIAGIRTDLESARAAAERKLAELAFDEAIRNATAMTECSLPQLADLADWGREFVSTATLERDRQLAAAERHVGDAQVHMKAFDYAAAMQSLEAIPGPLFHGKAATLLAECRSRQEEVTRLIAEIGERIKRKEIDGLLPRVERALALRGDRPDLLKIRQQLVERRNTRVANARAAFEAGDARTALTRLSLGPGDLDEDAAALLMQVQQAVECEKRLAAAVHAAKADGRLSVEDARRIHNIGEQCLELNPHNQKVKTVVDQCLEIMLKDDVSLSIRKHGLEHIETARALNIHAVFCINHDKPDKAEPLLKKVQVIMARLQQADWLAPDCEEQSLFLRNLAACYDRLGRHPEAVPLFKQALDIREIALGADHAQTVQSILDLAECYAVLGEEAKREPLLRRLLALSEKSVGPDHPDTLAVVAKFAHCLWCQKKYPEQERPLQRLVEAREKTLGPNHPDTAAAIWELANCLSWQDRNAEAEPLCRRALAISEEVSGQEHLATANNADLLAHVLSAQDRYADAEPYFKQALAVREKALGDEHSSAVWCRESLQACRDQQAISLLSSDLDEVTREMAEVLRHYSDILVLDTIASITPEAAAVLTRHSHGLSLEGLSNPAPAVASALAEYQGSLFLGLETLTNDLADAFAAFRGNLLALNSVRELASQTAKRLLQRTPDPWLGILEFDGLVNASLETLAALVTHDGILSLRGLTALTPEAAAILSRHKGEKLILDGLTHLDAEIGVLLSRRERGLDLNGLKHLSLEAAQSIWKCRGLGLNGLAEISPEVADCLARCDIGIGLCGLTEITGGVAERLANARCSVNLDGLHTLTSEAANSLRKSEHGSFSLLGLNWLCQETFDSIQPNLNIVLPDTLTVLADCKTLSVPPLRNSIDAELKLLPGGTFMMEDARGDSDQKPHRVTLSRPFYIGVYEVTNAQWKRVMGNVPSRWKDDDRPVENVSWDDAIEFCRKLSALPEEVKAGRVYRLPTEAEWEYACRAGSTAKCLFDGWFAGNSGRQPLSTKDLWDSGEQEHRERLDANACEPHPVGKKRPNDWGLYDMCGNVWEWCSDWYGDYPKGAVTDPHGPSNASDRVLRGGSWRGTAWNDLSAVRYSRIPSYRDDSLGFRLALSPSGVQPPPQ